MMAKLKSDGVTTIIDVLDSRYGLAAALKAATSAEYQPEWMMASGGPTGGGAFPTDLDIILRVVDQDQAAHFFGLNWFFPYVKNPVTANPFSDVLGDGQGQRLVGRAGPGGGALHADPPRRTRPHRRPR